MGLCVLLLLVSTQTAAAPKNRITGAGFEIVFEGISEEQAEEFAVRVGEALKFVRQFTDGFYEAQQSILIKVSDDYRIPSAKHGPATITVPANRIRGDAPGRPSLRGRGPVIAHEITHILAKSKNRPSRYLDEGLGVYLQERFERLPDTRRRFGIVKSYPAMGVDLHRATACALDSYGEIVPLNEVEKLRMRKGNSGGARRVAYLQEGSFVRYLIETHGREKFLTLYSGGTYRAEYGQSRDDLEMSWRAFITQEKSTAQCN